MDIIDEPIIIDEENDFIGSLNKANSIKKFIENNNDKLKKNNMIAIYGEWGSGKSSLMKTIDYKLENEKYEKIWIDMWKEESDYSNLSIKILNKILSKLELDNSTKRDILKAFCVLGKGIKVSAGIISYDMKSAFEQIEKEVDNVNKVEEFLENFKEKINNYNQKTGKNIIVFLDDLDRCSNENMLNIIYNIKLLLSVENIIFIFGIDKYAVTLALKNKYNNEHNKAESFLEKIFPISFNMPKNVINLKVILKSVFKNLTENQLDEIEKFFIKINLINPRKLKKIFLRYLLIESTLCDIYDIKNEWNIIWILYLIIEHEFDSYNYYLMLKENKNRIFSRNLSLDISRTSIKRPIAYREYPIYLQYKEKETDKYYSIGIYEYIMNPKDLTKKEVAIIGYKSDIGIIINFESWMEIFKDTVNSRFANFFFENKGNFIKSFGKDYNELMIKIKEIIIEVDGLL